MDFGRRFKFYRQKANLTQKEAAEQIGINDYQLGNYETNRSQPSLEVLRKMSKVYRTSIDKMLGNDVQLSKHNIETEKDDYVDIDQLLAKLNDVVEEINKANKK